ncbi:MerR family transcriptional regulator [Sphaerimonospora sp. CA-214678]|uniref:MerR family transcriptional regulator n=1 Tax=Sphaerimonospora sp. CA-214678 TaxID=3240029 RepID=UPI003D94A036
MSGSRRRARRTVPTRLAALALGVPEATIRKWASRGKLSRYGSPGRAEYDLDELFHVAAAAADPEKRVENTLTA